MLNKWLRYSIIPILTSVLILVLVLYFRESGTSEVSSPMVSNKEQSNTASNILTFRQHFIDRYPALKSNVREQALDLNVPLDHVLRRVQESGLSEETSWISDLRWDIPEDDYTGAAEDIVKSQTAMLDSIAQLNSTSINYENTLGRMMQFDAQTMPLTSSISFMYSVAVNQSTRTKALNASLLIDTANVDADARADVYRVIVEFSKSDEVNGLSPEKKRLLEYVLRGYRRVGLHLSPEMLEQVTSIRRQIADLELQFSNNINEENTILNFTKDQLRGLTDAQLNAFQVSHDGPDNSTIYHVTLKTPDYNPIMKYCSVPDTRYKMERAYNSRCQVPNVELIERLAHQRSELAKLLGYPTYVDYKLEVNIAKNGSVVRKFLDDINVGLDPLYEKDRESLMSLKREECATLNIECDDVFHIYDRLYYTRMYNDRYFNIDDQQLREYFPFDTVVKGMFDLYQLLFSVTFEEIHEMENNQSVLQQLWHPDVRLFKVFDNAAESQGTLLGYFYMDMFPRTGKYSHAAAYTLISGASVNPVTGASDQPIIPVVAMVCNFPQATASEPSTLTHNDVVTILHEFGHCQHTMLSQTELQYFSGTSVAQDFVEAPSQMLENWAWEPTPLKMLSKHIVTGEQLPDSLIEQLVLSRMALTSIDTKRQLVFGILDQSLHTSDNPDSYQILLDSVDRVFHDTRYMTPGTNNIASFGHLAGGYDARYYAYLWSEVYAADMFVRGFSNDTLNPEIGLRYRRNVLQVGNSIDAIVAVTNFLGSPPNMQAFLQQKGLGEEPSTNTTDDTVTESAQSAP